MHYYHSAPIDHWFGALDMRQLLAALQHHFTPGISEAADRLKALNAMVEESGPHWKKLGWEGDVQDGPFFFAVPGDGGMRFGCIIKQSNNGNCFIASPSVMARGIKPTRSSAKRSHPCHDPEPPARLSGPSASSPKRAHPGSPKRLHASI